MENQLPKKRKFVFETKDFVPNRISIVKDAKILEPNERFCFSDSFYSNEDESIILKTSFNFGKIFKPL